MPPLPRLKTPAMRSLEAQLRYAPPEVIRRDLARAESLAAEVQPAGAYPEDWITFRITGYRPDVEDPALIPGEAVLADLSALVERLSDAAGLGAGEVEGALSTDELCRRWGVSRKTIERYRRKGLVARRVVDEAGIKRLAFAAGVVEAFEAAHSPGLDGARRFTRIEPAIRERIIQRARRYRRLGCSLNEAALRLSRRHGRSHEAVRQLLIRQDAGSQEPIFGRPIPPASRRRRIAWRAWRRGIEPRDIARRWGRSRASVVRMIADERAAMLRAQATERPGDAATKGGDAKAARRGVPRSTRAAVGRDEADSHDPSSTPEPLAPPPVREGLGEPGETDLLRLIASAREQPAPNKATELPRARAYRFLLDEAFAIIAGLAEHGASPAGVDRAETALRWAARLKAELVRAQLPLMVRTLESQLGTPLDRLRTSELASLIPRAIAAVGEGVDVFDPAKGGRLAAPCGLALSRAATRWGREVGSTKRLGQVGGGDGARGGKPEASGHAGGRASPRPLSGVAIPDWTLRVCPWQSFLEPDPRIRPRLAELPELERAVLAARHGWDGGPPMTLAQIANRLDLSPLRTPRLERRAVRLALAAARGSPTESPG